MVEWRDGDGEEAFRQAIRGPIVDYKLVLSVVAITDLVNLPSIFTF